MIVKGVVKRFGKLIAKAEQHAIEEIQLGRVETEPSVTDRFLREIELVFEENGQGDDVRFHVRTLGDRRRDAAGRKFGADFCGILQVRFGNFQQAKGFLSQAKMDVCGVTVSRQKTESRTAILFQVKCLTEKGAGNPSSSNMRWS
jgi:hypothetical protein